MKTALLVVSIISLVLGACDSKEEPKGQAADPGAKGSDPGAKAKAADPTEEDPYAVIDFQALKRVVTQETVDGIAFTVELPEHRLYKKEIKKSDGTFPGYVTWQLGFRDGPGFTVQPVDFPASAESLKDGLLGPGQTVTLAEALPDGGLLQVVDEDTKKYFQVTVYRKNAAGQGARFSVSERRRDPIPGYDAEKAWAITVAKSFTLK
jgi:hypothetical protein